MGSPWWSSGQDFAFHCRGCRFNPWAGNEGSTFLLAKIKKLKKKNIKQEQKDFKKKKKQEEVHIRKKESKPTKDQDKEETEVLRAPWAVAGRLL